MSKSQSGPLTGFFFCAIVQDTIQIVGRVLSELEHTYLCQFDSTPSYTRLMTEQDMLALTLFPTQGHLEEFIEAWRALHQPAPANDGKLVNPANVVEGVDSEGNNVVAIGTSDNTVNEPEDVDNPTVA